MSRTYNDQYGQKLVFYFKDRTGKDNRNYPRGYFEIKGQLYKIDLNPHPNYQKDKKEGTWGIGCIRKARKQDNSSSDFGPQSGGRGGWNNRGSNGMW